MFKKPIPADFEISKKRVWHRPTDESFFRIPANRQMAFGRTVTA